MRITKLRKSHVKRLKEWNSNKFPFPDLDNPLYIIRGSVVAEDGTILGAGFIKLTSEVIIILDPSLTKVNRMSAIFKLFGAARKGMISKGLDGTHAFTNDPSFARFLTKRLHFRKADKAFYLRLT